MNKKIIIPVLFLALLATSRIFAQTCNSPCITNGEFNTFSDWTTSHGATPTVTANNAPGSTVGGALLMFSHMGAGNGAFTCYNFDSGVTYRICFWVRNVSSPWPSNPWGSLQVYAVRNMPTTTNSNIPAYVSNSRFIDSSYYGPPAGLAHSDGTHDWEYISVLFTPDMDYNCLWFYPKNLMGPPPPGPAQWPLDYKIEIDNIRVSPEINHNIMVSATKDSIAGCSDQSQITVSNVPPNATVNWDPPIFTPLNGQNSVVLVQPCSTTTYEIEVIDNNASCPGCLKETYTYTIYVDQLGDTSRLTAPATLVCGDTLKLSYAPDPNKPCAATYTWKDPQGTTIGTGLSAQVLNPTSANSGVYTLEIGTPKGCSEILTTRVTISGCCRSNPDFVFSGCNPVVFQNTSTGNSALVTPYWSFGDGATSVAMNPAHNYATTTATQYSVCLTMMYKDTLNGESCCNRVCKQVPVCASPPVPPCLVTADFNFSTSPVNTAKFTDNSSGNGIICGYEWNFGDGSPVVVTTAPAVTHSYPSAGPFNVCLKVTNCLYDVSGNFVGTCTDIICKPVNFLAKTGTMVTKSAQVKAEDTKGEQVKAYPNPVSKTLSISVNGIRNAAVVVTTTDGALIGKATRVNDQLYTFETSNLAPGVYLVEVLGDNKKKVIKFVKE